MKKVETNCKVRLKLGYFLIALTTIAMPQAMTAIPNRIPASIPNISIPP